ncbi:MAG: nuclear transport factor 2 family protein, partial [Flavobacteriaceae bacterium]
MKPTKKIESEVLKVYETWMHSYLNGDTKTYDSYLDVDFHFIGSTNNEEFLNRKDTTQFFSDTGEQFAGKTELRNETKVVEQFGELIFITHFFDAWFLADEKWNFYSRFRFSNALKKNKEGWRFIYQHYSVPDSKAEEGETIGYNKINEENQELREAIKRRTKELEQKNRELEIESALERTRIQSMLMQHSNELDVTSRVFHEQLLLLGIPSEFSYVWLPDVAAEKHMFWATWNEGSKNGNSFRSKSFTYDLDKTEPYTAACFEAWESGKIVHIVPIPPKEVAGFFEIWSELLSGAESLKAENFPDGLYYAEAY